MQRSEGMNTEKAIKEIKRRLVIELASRCYGDPEYIEALEMAIEALRKQEPVKPKACHVEPMYTGWHYQYPAWTKAGGVAKYYFCPRCGQAVGVAKYYFCPRCGQAVVWEE